MINWKVQSQDKGLSDGQKVSRSPGPDCQGHRWKKFCSRQGQALKLHRSFTPTKCARHCRICITTWKASLSSLGSLDMDFGNELDKKSPGIRRGWSRRSLSGLTGLGSRSGCCHWCWEEYYYPHGPIRGQYSGDVTCLDQSQASITWGGGSVAWAWPGSQSLAPPPPRAGRCWTPARSSSWSPGSKHCLHSRHSMLHLLHLYLSI